jgi:hypothetical protein
VISSAVRFSSVCSSGDAMEGAGIFVTRGDEKAPWLLKDSPGGQSLSFPVLIFSVDIENRIAIRAHCGGDGIIRRSVLVRHYSFSWLVLVDQDMIGPFMYGVLEIVLCLETCNGLIQGRLGEVPRGEYHAQCLLRLKVGRVGVDVRGRSISNLTGCRPHS